MAVRETKMKNVLIVIPAYNEGANIAAVVEDVRRELPAAALLVVNDGSSDDTSEVLRRLAVPHLNLPFNLGYSGALQAGFKYAVENDFDVVVQFDGDGQHMAAEAGKLLDALQRAEADIVIGSRFKENLGYHHPFFRQTGTRFFRWIIRGLCGESISDPTSGFQVLSRRVFRRYAAMYQYPMYPDANLVIEMILAGCRVVEVPVRMRPRLHGVSMHGGLVRPIKYMVKMVYSIVLVFIKYKVLPHRRGGHTL